MITSATAEAANQVIAAPSFWESREYSKCVWMTEIVVAMPPTTRDQITSSIRCNKNLLTERGDGEKADDGGQDARLTHNFHMPRDEKLHWQRDHHLWVNVLVSSRCNSFL